MQQLTDKELCDLRSVALGLVADAGLPLPRLQLTWAFSRDLEDGLREWICFYDLLVPCGQFDIRNLATENQQPFAAFRSGHTTCRTGKRFGYELSTPFRDGSHIIWDHKSLGFPMYVANGGKWRELPATPE